MKKLLITLALVGTVAVAYGQGYVNFQNGTLYKISTANAGTAGVQANPASGAVMPTTAGSFDFGLFYGIGGTSSMALLDATSGNAVFYGVNSTSAAGIIGSSADNKSGFSVGIPGTTVGETDVWFAYAGWSASYGSGLSGYNAAKAAFQAGSTGVFFGESDMQNSKIFANTLALGPSASPINIWTYATGTNPKLVQAFILYDNVVIPEPTTLALAGLGAAAMLIFRRRQ